MYDDLNDRLRSGEPGEVTLTKVPAPAPEVTPAETAAGSTPAVVEEVLIEEVSIDGMCGVY